MTDAAPTPDVEEALARARQHARTSASEALAAVQALVEAGARVPSGLDEATAQGLVDAIARARQWLDPQLGPDADSILAGVRSALDAEIHRWEEKSDQDPDARMILRAFLAVREVLWEISSRTSEPGTAPEGRPRGPQRVPVEG